MLGPPQLTLRAALGPSRMPSQGGKEGLCPPLVLPILQPLGCSVGKGSFHPLDSQRRQGRSAPHSADQGDEAQKEKRLT